MKLISCGSCGVMLDADRLDFPCGDRLYNDNGTINDDRAKWDGQDYMGVVECPVCHHDIDVEGDCYV